MSKSSRQPNQRDLETIITNPKGTKTLVLWADEVAKSLVTDRRDKLTTSQIRALFGEVRQIEAEWSMEGHRDRALHRLILLKPKMAYRARKERGQAVRELVEVLEPALDMVAQEQNEQQQDANFKRFVEFFEAILAYHKAHGGR